MKLNDSRLEIIARDLGMKALSPVIAVAGLVKDGFDSRQICEILKSKADCIEPVYRRVREIVDGDKAKRTQSMAKRNPKVKYEIPKDWEPDENDLALAKALGLDDVQIKVQASLFRGFWLEKGEKRPGWSASWRTWCGRFAERNGLQKSSPNESKSADIPLETWRMAVENFRDTGAWPMKYGPEPGQKGCRVPKELLGEVRS